MMTSEAAHALTDAVAFGLFTAACLFVYALYLVADSLLSRVVWADGATRWQKTKVVARYTHEQAAWGKAPETLMYGFVAGFVASFVLDIFWNGLKATFL